MTASLNWLSRKSTTAWTSVWNAAGARLAGLVTEEDLAMGRIYPSLTRIREVSRAIAIEVATIAFDRGLAQVERPDDLAAAVSAAMYEPVYQSLI